MRLEKIRQILSGFFNKLREEGFSSEEHRRSLQGGYDWFSHMFKMQNYNSLFSALTLWTDNTSDSAFHQLSDEITCF